MIELKKYGTILGVVLLGVYLYPVIAVLGQLTVIKLMMAFGVG